MPKLAQRRAREFFEKYGEALSGGDLEAIARCYAYPSLVVTETASRTLASPEELIDAFGASEGMLEGADLQTAVASIQSIESPTSAVAWVTVRWSYRDASGEERHADAYCYLVREADAAIEICTVTPVPVDWAA